MRLPKNLANNLVSQYVVAARPKGIRQRVESSLFPKQLEAYKDNNRYQVVVCSRRAGKTTGANKEMIVVAEEASEPGYILFLALTVDQADTNGYQPMLRELKELGYQENVHYKKNDTKRTITFLHNEVVIKYAGADKPNVINKFRGTKYYLIVIDEAGSFRYHIMEELVDEILTAAMADLGGTLQLRGTPPAIPNTYFEEAYKSTAWSRHYWTYRDNPHVSQNMEELIADILKRKGWKKDNPKFKREYLGEFVYDLSRMLLKFDPEKNIVTELPPGVMQPGGKFLGVDFGYRDSMAWVLLKEFEDKVYLIDSFKKNEMTPTLFAKEVKQVMRDHGLVFGDTFADPGGLGRAILEDYRFHHDLNLQDATKTGKGAAIEIFDEMLQTGRFLVYHTNYEAIKELAELEKDPKKPDQPLDGQEDHLFDAITYAVRATNAFQYFKADPVSEEDEMHSLVIQQDLERQRRSQEIINNDIDNFDDVIGW